MTESLDKLNIKAVDVIDDDKLPFIEIDQYKVPRLKRKHVKKIQMVFAPYFSKSVAADSLAIFNMLGDSDFEDLIIATALDITVSEVEEMSHTTYNAVVDAFTRLNPNFILGVAQELILRSQLQIDATPQV